MMSSAASYRPDIDGLRALAVLPVILFHAGLPGWGGGFVGVDVFFVISGFLITGILLRELAQGRYSLARFYERRARRILPALLAVTLLCLPFAWLLMLPEEMAGLGRSLIAVAVFLSNLYFAGSTDYFSPRAEEQPMLHTWSLAVEEQFYLLFPLLLAALWQRARGGITGVLGALLLASLGLSWLSAASWPGFAFYGLPTRAWQLLAGSLLAWLQCCGTGRPLGPLLHELGAGAGLLLLVASWCLIRPDEPYPAASALMPTLAAVLILACGAGSRWAGRLLAWRPLVGIGLISYSAYLWHQPLFAMVRLMSLERPAPLLMAGLAGLTLPLAWLTWRWVEQPFRQGRWTTGQVLAGAVLTLLLIAGLGAVAKMNGGWAQRHPLPPALAQSMQREPLACFDRPVGEPLAEGLCRLGDPARTRPDLLILGDSHMAALLPGIAPALSQRGWQAVHVGYSGCPPLLGVWPLRKDQAQKNCQALNERLMAWVQEQGIRHVLLIARWTYYTDGGYDGRDRVALGRAADDPQDLASSRAVFQSALRQTLDRYAALGVQVHWVRQVPQQRGDAVDLYLRAFRAPAAEREAQLLHLSVARADHAALQAWVDGVLEREQQRLPATLRRIDFDGLLCGAGVCPVGRIDRSRYADDDHLSAAGARDLTPQWSAFLAGLEPPP